MRLLRHGHRRDGQVRRVSEHADQDFLQVRNIALSGKELTCKTIVEEYKYCLSSRVTAKKLTRVDELDDHAEVDLTDVGEEDVRDGLGTVQAASVAAEQREEHATQVRTLEQQHLYA